MFSSRTARSGRTRWCGRSSASYHSPPSLLRSAAGRLNGNGHVIFRTRAGECMDGLQGEWSLFPVDAHGRAGAAESGESIHGQTFLERRHPSVRILKSSHIVTGLVQGHTAGGPSEGAVSAMVPGVGNGPAAGMGSLSRAQQTNGHRRLAAHGEHSLHPQERTQVSSPSRLRTAWGAIHLSPNSQHRCCAQLWRTVHSCSQLRTAWGAGHRSHERDSRAHLRGRRRHFFFESAEPDTAYCAPRITYVCLTRQLSVAESQTRATDPFVNAHATRRTHARKPTARDSSDSSSSSVESLHASSVQDMAMAVSEQRAVHAPGGLAALAYSCFLLLLPYRCCLLLLPALASMLFLPVEFHMPPTAPRPALETH